MAPPRRRRFNAANLGNFVMLGQDPQFLKNLVELLLIRHGENFLHRDFAVMQFNAAIGKARHYGIMGNHHNGSSLPMKFTQQPQNDLFVDRIQISRGFVGEDDLGVID